MPALEQIYHCRVVAGGKRSIGWAGIVTSIFVFIVFSYSAYGQGILPGPPRHPDGILGKPHVGLEVNYASVSGDAGFVFDDITGGTVSLGFPATPSFTLGAVGRGWSQADSTYFQASGLIRLYLGNPLAARSPAECNPDGRTGLPVFELLGGADLSSAELAAERWWVDASLVWPLSPSFSLGAGYRWLEETRPDDPIQGYGLIRWYSAPYADGELYENPDGRPGALVIGITAGASSEGSAGRLDIDIPLNASTTVGIGAAAEMLDARGETRLTARLRLALYPR